MRRNLFVWILFLILSAWLAFYGFFFTDSHLLSWASSLKDETKPLKHIQSFKTLFNSFSAIQLINERTIIEKTNKKRHINNEEQKLSSDEEEILKRYSKDFKTDLCRIHQRKHDWKEYLAPCAKRTKWSVNNAGWKNKRLRTCAASSYISKWNIRPAGEFSRFFIQSKTSSKKNKNIGGDSWRIHIKGAFSISATIFDHNDGSYEVVFLIMEAGFYQIEIILDYTLCDGFKDPPDDWYKKGDHQGKSQPDGSLQGDHPYLMERFGDGKYISTKIPEPNYSKKLLVEMDKFRKIFLTSKLDKKENICGNGCPSLISDGFGRWTNRTWKPIIEDLNVKREPRNNEGVLWIYGDSVSQGFKEYLLTGPYSEICGKYFKHCKVTYSWVYNIDNVEREQTLDGKDYDHGKVMEEINKVLEDKQMDEHSVIMLNWGIHFAAAVNFTNYQRLIDDFLKTVEDKRTTGKFKGKIIWRTTTAIFRERFPNPHKDVRRFLTFPRIILYNAYARSAMCKAGVDVFDAYSMTDSFPPGTVSKVDPVHYGREGMEGVQSLLYHKFKRNGTQVI